MNTNKPQPPEIPILEVMAARCRTEKLEAPQAQASPPDVLEAQLCRENALRKMLQKMSDQRNGY